MFDPLSISVALTGIQKAVALVKHAAKTAQDVQSLGPALGNLFSAGANGEKAVAEAKASGNASNMQIAMQIELELDKIREIKAHYQLEFMKVGKVDVWNKIIERAVKMDAADKFAEQAAKDRAKKRKEEQEEFFIVGLVIVLLIVLFGGGYYVVSDIVETAKKEQHHGHKRKN